MIAVFRNKLFGVFCGRDVMRPPPAMVFILLLIPRNDLTPEGCLNYAGLRLEIIFWRGRLRAHLSSDVGLITREIAGRAGA